MTKGRRATFSRRSLVAAVALLAAVFLVGFVPLTQKVLEKCKKATVTGPATARASLDGVTGRLEILGPGQHRFIPDASIDSEEPIEPLTDPGPGNGGELQPLWRALDFFAPITADSLGDMLKYSQIDIHRRGWIRLDGEGDHLAVSLGSLGESEPDMPQVWIDNDSHQLVKVRLMESDGGDATLGPSEGMGGWPWWIKLGDGRILQIMSTPEPFDPPEPIVPFEPPEPMEVEAAPEDPSQVTQ